MKITFTDYTMILSALVLGFTFYASAGLSVLGQTPIVPNTIGMVFTGITILLYVARLFSTRYIRGTKEPVDSIENIIVDPRRAENWLLVAIIIILMLPLVSFSPSLVYIIYSIAIGMALGGVILVILRALIKAPRITLYGTIYLFVVFLLFTPLSGQLALHDTDNLSLPRALSSEVASLLVLIVISLVMFRHTPRDIESNKLLGLGLFILFEDTIITIYSWGTLGVWLATNRHAFELLTSNYLSGFLHIIVAIHLTIALVQKNAERMMKTRTE